MFQWRMFEIVYSHESRFDGKMCLMSTIEEVAFLAKVSVATVSRVINDKGNVSDETKQRVEAAIKQLKYQPNAMGVLLRKEKTEMVLVLLHSVDNPFFSSIVQGIEKVAHENNYNVLISTTYSDHQREDRYVKMLKHHFVDGVILITNTYNKEDINELNNLYPVAQALEYIDNSDASYFSVDFYAASVEVINHLIASGRKRIAFAYTGSVDIVSASLKYKAYKDVLTQHHLPILTPQLQELPFGYESGKQIAHDTLRDHPDVDGFFASSDLIACGILDELAQQGKTVPKDISVVGFDNTIYSQIANPKLTTVEVNGFKMGEAAMQYILQRVNHPHCPKTPSQVFETTMLIGESS